jgi:stringent starvation protein B
MVPIIAVLGIYARETGQGMIFSEADAPPPSPTTPTETPAGGTPEVKRAKPTLKVVK